MNIKDALGKRIPALGEGMTFSLRLFFDHDLIDGIEQAE